MTWDLMRMENRNEGNRSVIYLFGRDENLEPVKVFRIDTFTPYFFVPDSTSELLDIFDRPVKRIETRRSTDVVSARVGYPFIDEGKIRFFLRYLIDKGIICGCDVDNGELKPAPDLGIVPKVLMGDIETESPPEIMAKPENPQWPIVSAQYSNNYNDDIDVFLLLDGLDSPLAMYLEEQFGPIDKYVERSPVPNELKEPLKYLPIECQSRLGTEVLEPNLRLYTNERRLIWDVCLYHDIVDPDILTYYNGNLFDLPYWIRRARTLHVDLSRMSPFGIVQHRRRQYGAKPADIKRKRKYEPYVKGRDIIDLFEAYQKWIGGRQGVQTDRPFGITYDFKRVVAYETGFKYFDYGDQILRIRRKDPAAWIGYCTKDAYALRLLDRCTGIFAHFDRLRRIAGTPVSWALSNKKLIDTFMLRIADKPLPTAILHTSNVEVKGAVVIPPPVGVHSNIAGFDIKAIYPWAIISHNLSAETKDPKGDIFVGGRYRYKSKPEGILPRVVRMFLEQREHLRMQLRTMSRGAEYDAIKQLETLYKFLACSVFGVNAYRNFRLFDPDVANSITYIGRECIFLLRRAAPKAGYKVIYGDTDSVFVKMNSKHFREVYVVEQLLNDALRRFTRVYRARYPPEVKFERLYKRIIFKPKAGARRGQPAKKRYAGYVDGKGLHIIGFEPRSSAAATVTRQTMYQWFNHVLVQNDVDAAVRLLRDVWKRLPEMPLNEVFVPRGLHQETYKVKNPWLEGVKYMNTHYKKAFREDKRPLMGYVKKVIGKPQTESICITEDDTTVPPEIRIDWRKMRKVVLKKKFAELMTAIGLDWTLIESGTKQEFLPSFPGFGRDT